MTALGLALSIGFPSVGSHTASAATPSFDCEGARGDIEKLICADDELAELDVTLARDLAAALARAPANEVSALKTRERDWRKTRNNCARAPDPRQCTLDAYRKMLGQL
ncbi:lysozyme inhibitor LprI family protein [Methylobrevis pamukkalensis]|uniref:lysozyme inhibitor LprI family protein n=1 Tax=Methylobrevis pamukkalensis TaxID=1439726 RepID=UPI00114CCF1E|nr:lysozyme inhibitor LprI family protein [Methylobrevis pamukkalensis]